MSTPKTSLFIFYNALLIFLSGRIQYKKRSFMREKKIIFFHIHNTCIYGLYINLILNVIFISELFILAWCDFVHVLYYVHVICRNINIFMNFCGKICLCVCKCVRLLFVVNVAAENIKKCLYLKSFKMINVQFMQILCVCTDFSWICFFSYWQKVVEGVSVYSSTVYILNIFFLSFEF